MEIDQYKSNEEFFNLTKYFNISGKKGMFRIGEFVSNFSDQIPKTYTINDQKRSVILQYEGFGEDADRIYPIGLVSWDIVHAKNPSLSSERFHRSTKNLEKTKELYPTLYNIIKDKDISVRYGIAPNEKFEKHRK